MPGQFNLGDNFSIDEDSNGDYVITYDPTSTVIERIDSGNAEKVFEVGTQISDLKDAASGDVVYDSSAEELTADVNNQSVSTENSTTNRKLIRDLSTYNPHVHRGADLDASWGVTPSESAINPLISGADVTVKSAVGVADPFVRWDPSDGVYHQMVEALSSDGTGDIVHFTSPDMQTWSEDTSGLAIDDGSNHLSYPFFFAWDGTWYMTPSRSGDFEIWEKGSSWTDWALAETPLSGAGLTDPTPIYRGGRWFALFRDVSLGGVRLYVADEGDSFVGRSWSEHPDSPILTESADGVEGPCGRPIVRYGVVDQVFQTSGSPKGIALYRISGLTPTSVTVNELPTSPILQPASALGWDGENTHHCEVVMGGPVNQPRALIDAKQGGGSDWEIGLFDVVNSSPTNALIHAGSTINIPSGSYTKVNFTKVQKDYTNNFDGGNYEYIIPHHGGLKIISKLRYSSGDSASRFYIRVFNETTSTELDVMNESGSSQGFTTVEVSSVIDQHRVSKGDRISVYAYQDTGSGVDLAGNDASWLYCEPTHTV